MAPPWSLSSPFPVVERRYNPISTLGSFMLAVGVLFFLYNVFSSLRSGRPAGDDPWEGDTLEWVTTSPPAAWNFRRIPVVHSARPLKEDVPGAAH